VSELRVVKKKLPVVLQFVDLVLWVSFVALQARRFGVP
jgi:hypothetical protein